jgi:hypothetical protein
MERHILRLIGLAIVLAAAGCGADAVCYRTTASCAVTCPSQPGASFTGLIYGYSDAPTAPTTWCQSLPPFEAQPCWVNLPPPSVYTCACQPWEQTSTQTSCGSYLKPFT